MRLTANFDLDEFLVSGTAERMDIDMTPPLDVRDNLKRLCETLLQPIRDGMGAPIGISSGYRPPDLNRAIGGADGSAHQFGRAADFKVIGFTPYDTAIYIRDQGLPFDQLICEFNRWVHIAIADEEPRLQELTAFKEDGRTKYISRIAMVA